jgi:CubicO group peptidase (beta-lactamase class C family)
MRIRPLCVSLILLTLLDAPSLTGQESVADYVEAIESAQHPNRQGLDGYTLKGLMEQFGVPGVSVAVVHDFAIHWAKAYGIADVETGAPVDVETMFQAASISKPVAAMAVLKAVQDGSFSLDEDINNILRNWTLAGGRFTRSHAVTPRTLMSHTSGLGDGFGFPGYSPSDALPTTVQILNGDAPSNVGDVSMARPPLTAMKYSGGGVTVMQLALSDALGRRFPAILQEYVLAPIGMANSFFEQPLSPARDRNAARAHDDSGNAMDVKWHVYPELAAAGLWTTPTDLAEFAIEVQKSVHGASNRVLSRTTIQEMLNPVGVGNFAVGFSIIKDGEGWYFSHGGSNWGFRALLIAHKVKGYGLVVMANGSRGGTVMNEIKARVERAYSWDSLDKPVLR